MDADEAFDLAKKAVTALVKERGKQVTFPLDAIWRYSPKAVPSLNRPATASKLERAGYLATTGRYTAAETEARAGSPTREFRPGPHFGVTGPPPPPVATATPTAPQP